MEQNTQEWLDYRRTRIGSSDAPVILGLSPWSTPYDLYQEKMNGTERKQNWAMSRGKELEPIARKKFEDLMMIEVSPKVMEHPKLKWQIASLDGISADGKTAVEIKCPTSMTTHAQAAEGIIPDHYKAQMQHQMCVAGLDNMIYFSYFQGEGEMIMLNRDEQFIKMMIKKEKEFYDCLVNLTPPECEKEEAVLVNTEEFISLSEKYKELDFSLKMMNEEKAIIKDRLVEIASDRNIKGNGISVSKKMSEGRVNFKGMPKDLLEQVEKFRTEESQSWCIRIS